MLHEGEGSDINEGKSTSADKWGNDRADTAATHGIFSHFPGINQAADWFAKRAKGYGKFIHPVHQLIADVLIEEKAQRIAKTAAANILGNNEANNKRQIDSTPLMG